MAPPNDSRNHSQNIVASGGQQNWIVETILTPKSPNQKRNLDTRTKIRKQSFSDASSKEHRHVDASAILEYYLGHETDQNDIHLACSEKR